MAVKPSTASERAAFTIKEFCEAHRISEAMYFKLCKVGLGPRDACRAPRDDGGGHRLASRARAWVPGDRKRGGLAIEKRPATGRLPIILSRIFWNVPH
ncbi:hypothetical protein ACVWXO_005908 [Bradyrhizobium sp. LM2.7]